MSYIGAVLYIWLAGAAVLLLLKLLVSYPGLAALFAIVVSWVSWELYRTARDQHNSTRKQHD